MHQGTLSEAADVILVPRSTDFRSYVFSVFMLCPYMAVISPTDHWQIIETCVTLGKIAASSEYLDAFLHRIDKMKEVIPTFKT